MNWEIGIDMYAILIHYINRYLMRACCQHRELCSVPCGDINGKEIQKRGDVCKHTADSSYCTVEANTTL